MLVGVGDAGRDPARAVDELELVELVAEGDDIRNRAGEDAEVDPDAGVEDRRARRPRRAGSAPPTTRSAATSRPLASRLEEPEERQVEQVERDVAAEDRVGDDGPGRIERDAGAARAGSSARSPAIEPATPSAVRTIDDDDRDPPERDRSGMSTGVDRDGPRPCPPADRPTGPTAPRWRDRSAFAAASFSRSIQPLIVPPSPVDGGTSRPASQRLPRRTSRAMTSPRRNRPTWTPTRVQNTWSKPTLLNQIASVQSSIPNASITTTKATTRISDDGADPGSQRRRSVAWAAGAEPRRPRRPPPPLAAAAALPCRRPAARRVIRASSVVRVVGSSAGGTVLSGGRPADPSWSSSPAPSSSAPGPIVRVVARPGRRRPRRRRACPLRRSGRSPRPDGAAAPS